MRAQVDTTLKGVFCGGHGGWEVVGRGKGGVGLGGREVGEITGHHYPTIIISITGLSLHHLD